VLRRLVANADDLGLTAGVNNGIFDAHDRGILTSASLMANAPATADAIRRLRTRPALGIGVHVMLVDGTPTLSPARIPTLVQDDGRFYPSWKPFIVACLRGRVRLREVEQELTAQVERLRSEGIGLTHLDAHKHVHAYPPVFAIVARLAERFRIPVVRVPYERSMGDLPLFPWTRRDYRIATAHGIRTPQFLGRALTGILDADSLDRSLRRLRPGVTELMVHPGYVDHALRQMPTRLLASRATEVELLTSTDAVDALREEHIQLVRHDLMPVEMPATRSSRDAS
jgi:chitin disaccharide deacetylase